MNWNLCRGLTLVSVAWLMLLIEPISDTGVGYPTSIVAMFGTIVLGVGTSLLAVSYFVSLTTANPSGITLRRCFLCLLFPAAGVIAGAAALAIYLYSQSTLNPLFRLRFFLSRQAFDQAVLASDPHKTSALPELIGLFKVQRIYRYDHEVRFITEQCGVIDSCGLSYLPGVPPQVLRKTKLTHMAGPWYHLYEVF